MLKMWSEGATLTTIKNTLGCSEGALSGKLRVMDLHQKMGGREKAAEMLKAIYDANPGMEEKDNPPKPESSNLPAVIVDFADEEISVALRPSPASSRIPQSSLPYGVPSFMTKPLPPVTHCQWPIGEVGAEDFHLCGGAVGVGSYCDGHREIAYLPAKPWTRRAKRT